MPLPIKFTLVHSQLHFVCVWHYLPWSWKCFQIKWGSVRPEPIVLIRELREWTAETKFIGSSGECVFYAFVFNCDKWIQLVMKIEYLLQQWIVMKICIWNVAHVCFSFLFFLSFINVRPSRTLFFVLKTQNFLLKRSPYSSRQVNPPYVHRGDLQWDIIIYCRRWFHAFYTFVPTSLVYVLYRWPHVFTVLFQRRRLTYQNPYVSTS